MTGDDGFERFGDVGDGVHIVELAGGHDGREQGPVVGPDFMTGEERVFSGQAHRPDGVLDRIGVELETPVFEEAGSYRRVLVTEGVRRQRLELAI
jgi:hypothetical protein